MHCSDLFLPILQWIIISQKSSKNLELLISRLLTSQPIQSKSISFGLDWQHWFNRKCLPRFWTHIDLKWKTETIMPACSCSSVAVISDFIRNLAPLSKSFEKSFNGASTNLLILLEVHFLLPSEVQSLPQKRG